MSVKLISRVWADASIEGRAELLVLLAIADFSNDNGYAWPSIDTLAQKARCSERTVQYIVSNLVAAKKLEVKPNEGPHGTNIYVILGGCNPCTGGADLRRGGANGVPESAPGGCKNEQIGGAKALHPIRQDPSLEPSGTKSAPSAPTPAKPKFEKPAVESMRLYAAKIGLPESEADHCFDFYESKGWVVGQRPMRDWQAAMRNWKRNYEADKYKIRYGNTRQGNPRLDGVSQNNSVNDYAKFAHDRRAKADADLAAKVAANKNGPPPKA